MDSSMTDPANWPVAAKLILLLVPTLIIIIGMSATWLVAGTHHFSVMCEAFKNSRGLEEDRKLWGTLTLRSRVVIVAGVSVGVAWPKFGIRHGWLSENDYRTVPIFLKRCLQLTFWANTLGACLLTVNYCLIKC